MDLMLRRRALFMTAAQKVKRNLLGGSAMLAAFRTCFTNTPIQSDPIDGYYAEIRNRDNGRLYFSDYFAVKPDTQYTFFFDLSCTASTWTFSIIYTDDTSTRVYAESGSVRVRAVSSAGKTIHRLEMAYRNTTRNLYFAGSGIFEGDVPASDFEPYD